MTPWTLTSIEEALGACWAADTCSPDDLARAPWHSGNPAWGQCDITALVVNDLFGGDLVVGEVHAAEGEKQGYHWWNRLPSGVEVDLTRGQFENGQTITGARAVQRPDPLPRRRADEYILLRDRLATRLGPLPAPTTAPNDEHPIP